MHVFLAKTIRTLSSFVDPGEEVFFTPGSSLSLLAAFCIREVVALCVQGLGFGIWGSFISQFLQRPLDVGY